MADFDKGGVCLVCYQLAPEGTFRCDLHYRSLSSPYSVDNVTCDLYRENHLNDFRAIFEHGFKAGMNSVLREMDPKVAEHFVEILRKKRLIV